jgi:AraC-like DNA-binding protein
MPLTDSSIVHFFVDSLWSGSATGRRSSEISPLYIDRFRGPRVIPIPSRHRFWEMTCVLAGEGEMRCAQTVFLSPGTICLIPPGVEHTEWSKDARLDTIWIAVEGSLLPSERRAPVTLEDSGLAGFIEKLWLFAQERGEPIGPELDGMAEVAVSRFFRVAARRQSAEECDIVSRAMLFFDQHYSEPVSIAGMARRFRCSAGHLSRWFRKRTGVSPIAYLRNIRLRQAALLLQNTELPITEIAPLTGHPDPLYLSRVFHQTFGKPPSAYRQAARECRHTQA